MENKAWRQIHNNAASNIKQVLEATPHKTAHVRLLYFYPRPGPKMLFQGDTPEGSDTFQWPVIERDRVGGLRLMIWDKVKVPFCHYSHAPEESNLWTTWHLFPLDDNWTFDFKDPVGDRVGVELLYNWVELGAKPVASRLPESYRRDVVGKATPDRGGPWKTPMEWTPTSGEQERYNVTVITVGSKYEVYVRSPAPFHMQPLSNPFQPL